MIWGCSWKKSQPPNMSKILFIEYSVGEDSSSFINVAKLIQIIFYQIFSSCIEEMKRICKCLFKNRLTLTLKSIWQKKYSKPISSFPLPLILSSLLFTNFFSGLMFKKYLNKDLENNTHFHKNARDF